MESEDSMALIGFFTTAPVRTITETFMGLGLSNKVCVWVTKHNACR